MSTDGVTEQLRGLGAATDPSGDPVRPDEVRGGVVRSGGDRDPGRSDGPGRRWVVALSSAAAALVILTAVLALTRNRGDDSAADRVVVGSTSTSATSAPPSVVRLRLVVSAKGFLPVGEEGGVQQISISGPSGTVASGDLSDGDRGDGAAADMEPHRIEHNVLVVDRDVAPGDYTFRWRAVACQPSGCDGSEPQIDESTTQAMAGCEVTVAVRKTGWQTVVIDAALDAEPTCGVDLGEPPTLTVPPAWSLRPTHPARCGTDSVGSLSMPLYPGAPDPTRAPRTCLATAAAAGQPTELQTWDPLTGGTGRPMVLRVAGADRPVQVVRPGDGADPWTEQTCRAVTALDAYPWIRLDGCGAERTMPLTP